jgi:hypothetical protein
MAAAARLASRSRVREATCEPGHLRATPRQHTRWIVALLAAGCGLAPNESFTGKRVADGVAAWRDLGSVELCLGNGRVGPGGSAVGGLCADRNLPVERTCNRDDECRTREVCMCGRCTIKYCSSNAECGPGRACAFSERRCLPTCLTDDDCPEGDEFCSAGVCRARCGADPDCQTGEVCGANNRCVVATCARDEDCAASEICRVQRLPRAAGQPSALALTDEGGALLVLYLEMEDELATRREVFRATSRDGLRFRFDPARPVIAGPARAPSAVEVGGRVRLYHEVDGGIALAESDDGVSFGAARLILPGDYRAPGAAVTPAGDTLVYVQVGDRRGISLFTGSGAPTPVLAPAQATDPELWRQVERVGSPAALVDLGPLGEPAVHLWFDAFGKESEASIQFGEVVEIPPNDSIGFASTRLSRPTELLPYPYNPIFDRIVAFLEHRAELAPSVVKVPGEDRYLLYYSGASGDGMEQDGLGVAENPPRLGR